MEKFLLMILPLTHVSSPAVFSSSGGIWSAQLTLYNVIWRPPNSGGMAARDRGTEARARRLGVNMLQPSSVNQFLFSAGLNVESTRNLK